jgi:hypothetical protein
MTTNARATIARHQRVLSEANLARVAYGYFRSITPIRRGNARNRTVLSNNEIHADYPYAQRLNTGWSRQAPNGMSQPTIRFILDYIKKQLGK